MMPPGPGSTETQASGTPASTRSSPSIRAVTGVSDAGLMITGLPQASAGAVFQQVISRGKFHGTISAHTPTGSRNVTSRPASGTGIDSPKCLLAAPAKYSNVPAAASTSQRASPIGLPALGASATANVSDRSRSRAATRASTRPRSVADTDDHTPDSNAASAVLTATSTSATPARAIVASSPPVPGSRTVKSAPSAAARVRPPTSSSWTMAVTVSPCPLPAPNPIGVGAYGDAPPAPGRAPRGRARRALGVLGRQRRRLRDHDDPPRGI